MTLLIGLVLLAGSGKPLLSTEEQQCYAVASKRLERLRSLNDALVKLKGRAQADPEPGALSGLQAEVMKAAQAFGRNEWDAGNLAGRHAAQCGKMLPPIEFAKAGTPPVSSDEQQCKAVASKRPEALRSVDDILVKLKERAMAVHEPFELSGLQADVMKAAQAYGRTEWDAGNLAGRNAAECGKLLPPMEP